MFNRADAVDEAFTARVKSGDLPDVEQTSLRPDQILDLLDTALMNRHLDLAARRSKGKTFYSIGSSGHEATAIVSMASRLTDMAFLHYRDAAFCIQRRKSVAGATPLWDMALSFAASSEDPVSGGRHKVLGGADIYTPPQTSTIASHLPKAMGMAHAVGLSKMLGHDGETPDDSVVLCSFGDASANHSTALGAINTAAWASYQGGAMPIVFVCEDNGIGISVSTPNGWIENNFSQRPGLHYVYADGRDPVAAFDAVKSAMDYARRNRKAVFLHLRTVRLMGHAGADIETAYKSVREVEENERQDPLLSIAAQAMKAGLSTDDLLSRYEAMRARVSRVLEKAFTQPKLETPEQVAEPIVPPQSAQKSPRDLPKLPKLKSENLTLARALNQTLSDAMTQYPEMLIFGEDVGKKGGVYGVTKGLQKQAGRLRVFDTLLDEQTILGTAIGVAHQGFLPVPEIQFLAYLHNAADQIRGEAATLSFFSKGQFTNPMVIRIAGLAYQRGFGGHFHNDNSITAIRDIPGLIVACPSDPTKAPALLRECIRLAHEERRVVVFIEPIALYHTTDLTDEGDWASEFDRDDATSFGAIAQHGSGKDLAILTYGNGYYLARQAKKELGVKARIIDLQWLSPLPMDAVLDAVKGCKHILIVDECRETGSLSEELMTKLVEAGVSGKLTRHCAGDCFIPLGPSATCTLPSKESIIAAAKDLVGKS